MTPAGKLVRRMLLLPVRDAAKPDVEKAPEVISFKAEMHKADIISRWIQRKSKRLRELNDELLGKVE